MFPWFLGFPVILLLAVNSILVNLTQHNANLSYALVTLGSVWSRLTVAIVERVKGGVNIPAESELVVVYITLSFIYYFYLNGNNLERETIMLYFGIFLHEMFNQEDILIHRLFVTLVVMSHLKYLTCALETKTYTVANRIWKCLSVVHLLVAVGVIYTDIWNDVYQWHHFLLLLLLPNVLSVDTQLIPGQFTQGKAVPLLLNIGTATPPKPVAALQNQPVNLIDFDVPFAQPQQAKQDDLIHLE